MIFLAALLVMASLTPGSVLAAGETATTAPPEAAVEPHYDTVHGEVRVDDYYWLRERDNPEVISYLEAENAYTEAMMKHTEELQEKLFQEMKGRIKETDLSVPTRIRDYYYYSRTEEGKQYDIFCRKEGSLDAEEEIILDVNELAEGYDFFSVGAFSVSTNQQLLLYAYDTAGSELYTLVVKDLATGELYPDRVPNVAGAEWANDNRTIFYTTQDEARRSDKLWRHTLGTDPSGDELVYHETDDAFWVHIGKTRSQEYMMLGIGSMVTSEWWYLDAENPAGEFAVVEPRHHEVEYAVNHHGEHFYIVTNDEAKNFRLVRAPVDRPSRENWEEVIAERETVMIEGADCFADYLVIWERKDALRQIRVQSYDGGSDYNIDFPEPVYTAYAENNPEYETNLLRFSYMSMVTPSSIYDYNMKTRERTLLKQKEVLGGYDPSQYESKRLWAVAPDGTNIPISLVYRKGVATDGSNPLYLYGYGSYGITMDPWFSSSRLSLLDRGFVYAVAHIRGSGAMGRYWYEDGKLMHKRNTFTDFIACANYLVDQGYTSHDRLVISGGSAGGLLIGAVINMTPDLAEVAIAEVPFVDVMNTMLDPTIPLTVIEYEEWGNPNEEKAYDYMMGYSPYDNVEPKEYPHLLITAGLNDPRVQYWEPAKWTARLRADKTDDNLLLLKTNMGAGHGGASGRYDYLREIAFEYAFLLDRLGLASE